MFSTREDRHLAVADIAIPSELQVERQEDRIMDLLANAYNDDSNTPKLDQNKEDSSGGDLLQSYHDFIRKQSSSTAAPKPTIDDSSDSDEDSSSDEDVKKSETAKNRSSASSEEPGSSSSSPYGSERSDASKKLSQEKERASALRDKRTSSGAKVSGRRSRSRSASRDRRRRRSSDRRRRSRSRDHHRRTSHSEKKSGRRSRSRSRSRDHRSRHHSRDHRRRGGHRRHHSSRDGHRRRRRSSSSRRHRHRSRSPDYKKNHSEKKRRSRSPRPSSSSKVEQAASTTPSTSASTGSSRPPVLRMSGTKYGRGRGASTGTFKELVREAYIENVQKAENAVIGNTAPSLMGPSQLSSSAATVSAGTGVKGGGGLSQVLYNQVQIHMQQQSQYLPGQPGCLTQEQKERNQKLILESTGRSREQVEAMFGVKISPIYNENTNNLVQLAEREKKRSLLFGNQKKKTELNSAFNAVPILPGESQSENRKFARLMGCMRGKPKGEEAEKDTADVEAAEKAYMESQIRNSNLEREFESSRQFTHFNRGRGLGYTTTLYQPH